MMYLLLSMMVLDSGVTRTVFSGTDVYSPLSATEVAVGPEGDVYVVNFNDGRVLHFSPDGSALADLGVKGQGPGEFQNPIKIWAEGNNIYVHDLATSFISRFENGEFVENLHPEGQFLSINRVKEGWVLGNWRASMDPKASIQVWNAGADFKSKQIIMEWPREQEGGAIMVEMDGGERPKIPFKPVRENNFDAVTPDGKYMFLSQKGDFKIDVIDVAAGKVVHSITQKVEPIPFNEEYGDRQLKGFKEANARMLSRLDVSPVYPEYYPHIRGIHATAEGYVAVDLWTANPDQSKRTLVFDRKGKQVKTAYAPELASRIVAIRDGKAWLLTYEDEEAGLIKCDVKDLDAVAAKHPINFDGFGGRLMMRMD